MLFTSCKQINQLSSDFDLCRQLSATYVRAVVSDRSSSIFSKQGAGKSNKSKAVMNYKAYFQCPYNIKTSQNENQNVSVRFCWKISRKTDKIPEISRKTDKILWNTSDIPLCICEERCIKVLFLKKLLDKINSSKNLQKLPSRTAGNWWGSFCKFLDELILSSTYVLKKLTLICSLRPMSFLFYKST